MTERNFENMVTGIVIIGLFGLLTLPILYYNVSANTEYSSRLKMGYCQEYNNKLADVIWIKCDANKKKIKGINEVTKNIQEK